jgi:hypothetical protein
VIATESGASDKLLDFDGVDILATASIKSNIGLLAGSSEDSLEVILEILLKVRNEDLMKTCRKLHQISDKNM